MRLAAVPLILGTFLIVMWYLALPPERPGFTVEPDALTNVALFIRYHLPRRVAAAFPVVGIVLVITGLAMATLTVVERRRRGSSAT